jgi:hypothetical protein
MKNKKSVTILCSGVALGVYIPGVSLQYQLRKIGYDAEVVVLENFLHDDIAKKIPDTKKAFHTNFKLAQLGQKMARDVTPSLDREKMERLFLQWGQKEHNHFVVFSGFWLPLLEKYGEGRPPESRTIDIVHMDSVLSPSWKSFRGRELGARILYLFEYETKKIAFRLNVTDQRPTPFEQRENRFLIHGGGWGMGTYQTVLDTLERRGKMLDIMAYYDSEVYPDKSENRYFMVDPTWHPWLKNRENDHTFPPVARIEKHGANKFTCRPEYHELFYVGARNKAIISKPGGSTLVDSLASATPFVFLESFGPHEDFNAALWTELGLGVTFATWEKSGFSDDILHTCHSNLLKIRESTTDFIGNFLEY